MDVLMSWLKLRYQRAAKERPVRASCGVTEHIIKMTYAWLTLCNSMPENKESACGFNSCVENMDTVAGGGRTFCFVNWRMHLTCGATCNRVRFTVHAVKVRSIRKEMD